MSEYYKKLVKKDGVVNPVDDNCIYYTGKDEGLSPYSTSKALNEIKKRAISFVEGHMENQPSTLASEVISGLINYMHYCGDLNCKDD